MAFSEEDKIINRVERAVGDLRRGFAVVIFHGNEAVTVMSAEDCALDNADLLANQPRVILAKNRIKALLSDDSIEINASFLIVDKSVGKHVGKCVGISVDKIREVACEHPNNISLQEVDYKPASEIEDAALKLVKIAALIPAAVVFDGEGEDLLQVASEDLNRYNELVSLNLHEVCRADLALEHAEKSEIIAYRSSVGGWEHYAIIVGEPGENPLVRVHSSCYTGDLLASLSCDCRDQLHFAIKQMGEGEGGIILYMQQEGRGIGLVNKLRAYDLKNQGMDTVDANEALGFDDDERLFLPAAQILKELGIESIRLLTNNPRKAQGLEDCDIKVSESVSHIMDSNEHNEAYLKTKADRLGHKF